MVPKKNIHEKLQDLLKMEYIESVCFSIPNPPYGIPVKEQLADVDEFFDDNRQFFKESVFKAIPWESWEQMPLSEAILYVMKERNFTNKNVYGSVAMQPSTFSRIVSGQSKIPSKDNLILVGIGLRLCYDDMVLLLRKGGYSGNLQDERMLLIKKYMNDGNYRLMEINDGLYNKRLKVLEPRKSPTQKSKK